jgi:hypothetical protein
MRELLEVRDRGNGGWKYDMEALLDAVDSLEERLREAGIDV